METTKTGFLEEGPGHKSGMRLFSLILLLFFIAYHLPFGWANARAAGVFKVKIFK